MDDKSQQIQKSCIKEEEKKLEMEINPSIEKTNNPSSNSNNNNNINYEKNSNASNALNNNNEINNSNREENKDKFKLKEIQLTGLEENKLRRALSNSIVFNELTEELL